MSEPPLGRGGVRGSRAVLVRGRHQQLTRGFLVKGFALVLGALAAMVVARVALAGSSSTQDLGRRLTGPSCINKRTGRILSIAASKPSKPGYIRKFGGPVTGPRGDAGP